jgi:hypothetical protein
LELYEKIYVAPEFLEGPHGEIACETCHGGDPSDGDWRTAHRGVVRDPSFPDPSEACGSCHPEIAQGAAASLHYTIAPLRAAFAARMDNACPAAQETASTAAETHCGACHASCGQCHVSRPDYVAGGLLSKHHFKKTPPMESTCAGCHGGRVSGEFTGAREKSEADIHFEDEEMTCMACHKAEEMHAAAGAGTTRHTLAHRPDCIKCHPEADAENASNPAHRLHRGRLACQVCHVQAYKNCSSCHVGRDKDGLPFFKCRKTEVTFKIGLNPKPDESHPQTFVVVRHPPADPEMLDHYRKGVLNAFDKVPTWKRAAPHNIRRQTEQNRECNNCHGNAALFLGPQDMEPWELKANAAVIVPRERVPPRLENPASAADQ